MDKIEPKKENIYIIPFMVTEKIEDSIVTHQIDTILVQKKGDQLVEFVTEIPVNVIDVFDVDLTNDVEFKELNGFVKQSDTIDLRRCNPLDYVEYVLEIEKQPFYKVLTKKTNRKGKQPYVKAKIN